MYAKTEKILCELKIGLKKIYGDKFQDLYLFGSYAREEAKPFDSDIDVMVILNGDFNYWEVSKQSSKLIAELSLKNDVVISRKFASAVEYNHSKMPLYINVRREGVAV